MSRSLRNLILLAVLASTTHAAEPSPADSKPWPLWDGKETIAEYAKRVNLPPTETLDLGGGVELELVLVPAGRFMMGTSKPEPLWIGGLMMTVGVDIAILLLLAMVIVMIRRRSWRPQYSLFWFVIFILALGAALLGGLRLLNAERELDCFRNEMLAYEVTLTQPFYMGKYEVTQEQYEKVTRKNPSCFKGAGLPVETVTWDAAQEFCKKASEVTGKTVRLPTEAEWEYACRAGTSTRFNTGDRNEDVDKAGWYRSNSGGMTHPVGQKAVNAWGLYDMHGNVWEWCQDWGWEYSKEAATDPEGAAQDAGRVLRGGSRDAYPDNCRSAIRFRYRPGRRDVDLGFRVVVVAPMTP